MPRVIFKCPHIRGGTGYASAHLKNLVSYIATREGAERVDAGRADLPVTEKQKKIVEKLLREFPLSRGLFEYEDYLSAPTRNNASEFITRALEDNLDHIAKKENYLDYIANRPLAQKVGAHGLFSSSDEHIVLSQVAEEVAHHPGTVWLPIISLRREDAARLGYDNAESWRTLLSLHASEIAQAMKIPQEQFRWYAAYHDEGHHPHVHMVCYSADGKEGFLTKDGIAKIKSGLARDIFHQDLTELYTQQTQRRDDLIQESAETLRQLSEQMRTGTFEDPHIEQLMKELSQRLQSVSGKKQYGYLKAPLKAAVDAIVDELAKDARIVEAYDLWYEMREEVLHTYKNDLPPRLKLSQQKEFKRIKNIIIEEAARIGTQTISSVDENADAHATEHPHFTISQVTGQPATNEGSRADLRPALLSATRLLHHMGAIFQDQTPIHPGGLAMIVDSKLKRKVREKKMAQGHKADDHEEQSMG